MGEKANIAIIILAAGSSSRMGQPKQLLKWGGSTLLNHCIKQAMNTEAKEVFVVLGANHDVIKSSIGNDSIEVLYNPRWEEGLGNSIAFSFQQIDTQQFDGVLLMLADQPQVDTILLSLIIETFQNGQESIISTGYKNGAGVPALFEKSYFKKLADLSGEKGAKHLIVKNSSKTVILQTPNPIIDIDTMEDYTKTSKLYDR